MKKKLHALLVTALLVFTVFTGCQLNTLQPQNEDAAGEETDLTGNNTSRVTIGNTKETSLYAQYTRDEAGNTNDRKIELFIYIEDGYLTIKVKNLKRRLLGSGWKEYQTNGEGDIFDLEIGTPWGDSWKVTSFMRHISFDAIFWAIGTTVDPGSYIKKAHFRATNQGVGAHYAVIDYEYIPPTPPPCAGLLATKYVTKQGSPLTFTGSNSQLSNFLNTVAVGKTYNYSDSCYVGTLNSGSFTFINSPYPIDPPNYTTFTCTVAVNYSGMVTLK